MFLTIFVPYAVLALLGYVVFRWFSESRGNSMLMPRMSIALAGAILMGPGFVGNPHTVTILPLTFWLGEVFLSLFGVARTYKDAAIVNVTAGIVTFLVLLAVLTLKAKRSGER